MANDPDTLDALVAELSSALYPLVAAFESPGTLRDFLENLGWNFVNPPAALDSIRTPATQGNAGAQGSDARNRILAVFSAISDLSSGAGLPAEFANDFPRQLVDYLLVDYLLNQQPRWGYLLMALGIVRLEERPATGLRPAY